MFAVIYRIYVKPKFEDEYCKLWNQIASYFITHRGALGSCLHRAPDGLWYAYSRWPDKATRDASWPSDKNISQELPLEIRKAIIDIKECGDPDRILPEICLDVVDDQLFNQNKLR